MRPTFSDKSRCSLGAWGLRKGSIQKQLEVSCHPQLKDTGNDFCNPDHRVASKVVTGALASPNELLFLGQSYLIALRHLGGKPLTQVFGILPAPTRTIKSLGRGVGHIAASFAHSGYVEV